jgi:curved DNA-binding protein CbpA
LGVENTATSNEIKKAYRALVLRKHPDRRGGSKEAFQALQTAYTVLSNPTKRERYDNVETPAAKAAAAKAAAARNRTQQIAAFKQRLQNVTMTLGGLFGKEAAAEAEAAAAEAKTAEAEAAAAAGGGGGGGAAAAAPRPEPREQSPKEQLINGVGNLIIKTMSGLEASMPESDTSHSSTWGDIDCFPQVEEFMSAQKSFLSYILEFEGIDEPSEGEMEIDEPSEGEMEKANKLGARVVVAIDRFLEDVPRNKVGVPLHFEQAERSEVVKNITWALGDALKYQIVLNAKRQFELNKAAS